MLFCHFRAFTSSSAFTFYSQVHVRIRYLRHLIVSLAQARDIDTTLLIFSHDFFNSEINDLIQSIDFCKVLQIFYPYSIQTHPNTFPGPSPNDCSRNMTIEEWVLLRYFRGGGERFEIDGSHF